MSADGVTDAPAEDGPDDEPPAIRVQGLTKTFGDGNDAVRAVDDLSVDVERGSVVGLLGPNGAGKTTAVKSMLGLVVPDAGTVEICGADVHDDPARAHDRVGAMLEGARNVYWRLTVRENLAFFAGVGAESPSALRERHDRLLALFDLDAKADTPVKELSRGMKQKTALATTLSRDVDVVFLDEPTLGLDVEAAVDLRTELRRLADEEAVTVVLCSHDMDVVEAVCDRVLVLRDGSLLVDDRVEGLLDAFDARTYRVTVPAPVGTGMRRELECRFDVGFERRDDEVVVALTTTDAADLYELLDALASAGTPLLDVAASDPDLEDAFLRLLDERDGPGADGNRAAPAAAEGDHQ